MPVVVEDSHRFEIHVPVLVVGAGAWVSLPRSPRTTRAPGCGCSSGTRGPGGRRRSHPDSSPRARRAGSGRVALPIRSRRWLPTYAAGSARDPFGREFGGKPPLAPPYYATKVTGALFHTQGGIVVDSAARRLDARGLPLPNLPAGGGAVCGLSGAHVWGYLSGNGLLAAVTLGRLAGASAAKLAFAES